MPRRRLFRRRDNTLTVGSNNLSTEVSGIIADVCGCAPGPGSLVKVGTGTLTLSGINTYTGTTTVNAGTLIVNGSIATSSLLTVNAGGTVGGTGILPSTFIDGGTLSPGNSIGTINVTGALQFSSAGVYQVESSVPPPTRPTSPALRRSPAACRWCRSARRSSSGRPTRS